MLRIWNNITDAATLNSRTASDYLMATPTRRRRDQSDVGDDLRSRIRYKPVPASIIVSAAAAVIRFIISAITSSAISNPPY